MKNMNSNLLNFLFYILYCKSASKKNLKSLQKLDRTVCECLKLQNRDQRKKSFFAIEHPLYIPVKLNQSFSIFRIKNESKIIKRVIKDENLTFNEANICLSFKHENIMQFYEFYEIKDAKNKKTIFYIVSEFLDIKLDIKTIKNDLKQIICILKDILMGLKYLHDNGYAHLDIRACNITGKIENNKVIYKISDFSFVSKCGNDLIKNINTPMNSIHFLPPEIFMRHLHALKSDIWCVGMLVLELIEPDILKHIHGKQMTWDIYKYNFYYLKKYIYQRREEKIMLFVNRCLNFFHEQRPTLDDLLNDKLFIETD